MSTTNEELAKIIDEKLKAEGLIGKDEAGLAGKLTRGQLKDFDWKIALVEVINKADNATLSNNEAE